jgi:hypothetical protein
MLPKSAPKRLVILLTFICLCLFSNFKLKSQNLPGYVPTNGLKAYYTFNGNANDVSGNQNNGQVNGAQLASDRFGINNCAYYFDGNSSIVVPSSPSNSSDITTNFSFACWYKLTSYFNGINSRFSPILQKANGLGALGHQYKIFVQPQTQTGFWGNEFFGYNYLPVNLDTWYFIAVTFDRGTIRYYVNGVLRRTQVFTVQSLQPTSNGDFEIGKDSPGDVEYLNGTLDDLGIWNRTLTQTEITALFTSCVSRDNLFTQDTLKVCSKSVTLDAGAGYTNYLWNNGSQNQTINVNESGLYSVNVTRGNCSVKDTIYLSIVNGNIENNDTSICDGQSLQLFVDANAVSGGNYKWSNNQTSSNIQVTPASSQTYYLIATNGITTCRDSVAVSLKWPSSSTNNITACNQYSWNGSTFTESGTYTFNTINAAGCDSTAILNLTINYKPETPQVTVTQPSPNVYIGSINVISPLGDGLQFSINNDNFQSQNTFSGLIPGLYSIVAKNTFGCISDATNVTINPAVSAGIFGGENDCLDFKSGNANPLGQLCYTGVRSKIFNVTPGVFFYYTLITAKTSSFAVEVLQTKTLNNFSSFAIQQENQIRMWDVNCNRIATGTSVSVGQGRIFVNNAVPGNTYILSVKYDAKSIIGSPYIGASPDCIYSFVSRMGGEIVFGSAANINLTSNCNNQSKINPEGNNTETKPTPTPDYFVYPSPTNHQFKLGEKIHISTPVDINVMDAQGKVLLRKTNYFINNSFGFGENLPKGLYFIEIRSGNVRKIIKAEKL